MDVDALHIHITSKYAKIRRGLARVAKSGDRYPGPLIFKVKKKLRALFAKVGGGNMHKLQYCSYNEDHRVTGYCLIKEHL